MYVEKNVRVVRILEENEDVQKIATDGGAGRAILYRKLLPKVVPGDIVRVNVTATTLKLGTGGWDIVISTSQPFFTSTEKGHIMKARYTSSQHSVNAVDAPEHEDHDFFQHNFDLRGKKILLAELHSMLPVLLGVILTRYQAKTVGVILSDEAAIPAGYSDHMQYWKQHERVSVVTTGQAFGGEIETTTIPNAIQWLVMKRKADVLIISMGHGTIGTNTPYGFSGMALAHWANLVGALGGIPIWIPRLSFQEKRKRHYGLSHHTLTPLKHFTYVPSLLPLPLLPKEQHHFLKNQLKLLRDAPVTVIYVQVEKWYAHFKRWYPTYPLPLRTMGRPVTNIPEFIQGILAAVALSGKEIAMDFREKTIRTKSIYKGKIIDVNVYDVSLPNGGESKREVAHHPGAVAVIAMTESGKIVLVRQFRKALEKEIYEIPAGKLEQGEAPIETAYRELEEETGYRAKELTEITSFYTSPGFSDEIIYLFEAKQLSKGVAQGDEDEFVEMVEVTLEEAQQMIKTKAIHDAKTVFAIYYLLQQKEQE